jgi:hypothetical protein
MRPPRLAKWEGPATNPDFEGRFAESIQEAMR